MLSRFASYIGRHTGLCRLEIPVFFRLWKKKNIAVNNISNTHHTSRLQKIYSTISHHYLKNQLTYFVFRSGVRIFSISRLLRIQYQATQQRKYQ